MSCSFSRRARYEIKSFANHSSSVEAQGRTLEELEWVYKQPDPVKASQHVDRVVQQADGTVTEKIVDRDS